VILKFQLEKNDEVQPEGVDIETEFYEANIRVDAILSYPWLAQVKLGIFPHHRALVLDNPELSFLFGLKDKRRKSPSIFDENAAVGKISALHLEKYGFQLPLNDFDQRVDFLEGDDLEDLQRNLQNGEGPSELQINRMIIARKEADSESEEFEEKISKRREKAFADFDGTVFRKSVFPDPPERGQYGFAYIPVKEGVGQHVRNRFFFKEKEKRHWKKLQRIG